MHRNYEGKLAKAKTKVAGARSCWGETEPEPEVSAAGSISEGVPALSRDPAGPWEPEPEPEPEAEGGTAGGILEGVPPA